ncbi:MAG: class I SAM-dependent methyltransferase [Calditrichaceae bacterium]
MPKKSGQNKFDEIASVWDESPRRIETAKAVFTAIIKSIPVTRNMDVLDFGCGTGLVSMQIQPYVKSVTAADNSAGMLNVLREKINKMKIENVYPSLITDSIKSLPDEKYDLIISSLTLHHINDYYNLLAEMYHLLNPGGYICIADLEKEAGDFHDAATDAVHDGFNQEILKENLIKIGYKSVSHKRIYTITKEIKEGKVKSFPVFLIIAQNPIN